MKTFFYLFVAVVCLLAGGVINAASRITATVTITNAPTTNGMTFVLNGSTRTWTNVVITPATQILTNSTIGGVTTNLFIHSLISPFAGPVTINLQATNTIQYIGTVDQAMTVSFSGNWASVSYSTQTVTSLIAIRVPGSGETASVRTNNFSLLTTALQDYSTNAMNEAATFAANLVGLTNAQTIAGIKRFTNASNQIAGTLSNALAKGVKLYYSNSTEIDPTNFNGIYFHEAAGFGGDQLVAIAPDQFGNPSLWDVSATNAPLHPLPAFTPLNHNLLTLGAASNKFAGLTWANVFTGTNEFAQITNTVIKGATISESTYSGVFGLTTNGTWYNGIINSPAIFDSTIYNATLHTNTLINPRITGNTFLGGSVAGAPSGIVNGIVGTNGTLPSVDPTNGWFIVGAGGEFYYRTSATSEGAGANNHVHNRAEQVTGSGGNFAFPDLAFNRVDFSGTDPQVALPTAGTYWVKAIVSVLAGSQAVDSFSFKFYNSTDAADISDSTRTCSNGTENQTFQVILENVVTVTAGKTIQLYGRNATAARGSTISTETSISYVRLY